MFLLWLSCVTFEESKEGDAEIRKFEESANSQISFFWRQHLGVTIYDSVHSTALVFSVRQLTPPFFLVKIFCN